MQTRRIGSQGLEASALGYGCTPITNYSTTDLDEARATVLAAVEAGITLFDTADAYGPFTNERLVGEWLRPFRDDVVIASKFGQIRHPDGSRSVDGSPEHAARSCDGSLERLGTDVIDLYYLHRVDPKVPVEESVGAMAELVHAGKVRHIGISEASADSIRRAHAVHPLSAVQSEYSLWTREIEDEVLPTMRDLGISLVAYGPLGRGFLTGAIRDTETLAEDDSRRNHPRFAPENLQQNLRLLAAAEQVAQRTGAELSQVALAWLLAQGDDVIPIPGTTKRAHLATNVAAVDLRLTPEEVDELRRLTDEFEVAGDRYPASSMRRLDR